MREQLCAAEVQVVILVAEGLSNREIGQRLATSEQLVARQIMQMLRKFDLRNRVQLAVWAVKQGLC